MSSIYTQTNDVYFNEAIPVQADGKTPIERFVKQSSIIFPSNVMVCGLSLAGIKFMVGGPGPSLQSVYTPSKLQRFGAGIDHISQVGTQVTFSVWMDFFNNTGNYLLPGNVYVRVLAIAECE